MVARLGFCSYLCTANETDKLDLWFGFKFLNIK